MIQETHNNNEGYCDTALVIVAHKMLDIMFSFKAIKAIKAMTLLVSCISVNAFSTPKPSHGILHQQCKFGSLTPSHDFHCAHQPPHHNFEHSLHIFSNSDRDFKPESIESYTADTLGQDDDVPNNVIGLILSALLIFTSVLQKLQVYLNNPCLQGYEKGNICTEKYYDFAKFFAEHEGWSFLLVLTHAIPFALLPWVSKQISNQEQIIKNDFPDFNPFIMQMAMACVGFGLSLEFGWHVADSWYYDNNFHVLNFGFYFFLISGFALWADGFKNNARMDVVFGLILAAATALYPLGNAMDVGLGSDVPEFLQGILTTASTGKIPLYIGMTATFLSITLRGTEIFGKNMYWVAFLCVGVNLAFIFALNGYAYQDGTDLNIMNYVLHICHDVLGTEAGVLVFGLLIKNYVPLADRLEENKS